MSVFIIVLLILNVLPLPVVVRLYSLLSMRKAECEPSSLLNISDISGRETKWSLSEWNYVVPCMSWKPSGII